jgi:hypothetical protein
MSLNMSAVISPTSGPAVSTFTAPDPRVGFGSAVFYNQSQSSLAVFLNSSGLISQTPDFIVPALTVITYPINGVVRVTVQVLKFPSAGGNINVTLTDAVLVAAASLLPGSVGAPGLFPGVNSFSFATATAFNLPSNSGASSSVHVLTPPAFAGQQNYIYSISMRMIFHTPEVAGSPTLAFVTLCSTNVGGTSYQQYTVAMLTVTPAQPLPNFNIGELDIVYSGGPTPLFIAPADLYFFFGDNSGTSTAGASVCDGNINIAYAVF